MDLINYFVQNYPYQFPNRNSVRVIRYGSKELGDESRGGTWYFVEKYEGYNIGRLRNLPVDKIIKHSTTLKFKKPLFIDVSNQKTEGFYPLELFKYLFGYTPSTTGMTGLDGEKKFQKIECQSQKKLHELGYDIVIFYFFEPDFPPENQYIPEQVFYVREEFVNKCKPYRIRRTSKTSEQDMFIDELIDIILEGVIERLDRKFLK